MITEKHLYLALEAYNNSEEETRLSELALDTIFDYILQNEPIEEEEILQMKAKDLVIGHALQRAVDDGVLEAEFEEGETFFSLTKKGEQIAQQSLLE